MCVRVHKRVFVASLCHICVALSVELLPHCTVARGEKTTDGNNERGSGRQTKNRVTASAAEVGGSPGVQRVGGGK